jgi:hypothetical protein
MARFDFPTFSPSENSTLAVVGELLMPGLNRFIGLGECARYIMSSAAFLSSSPLSSSTVVSCEILDDPRSGVTARDWARCLGGGSGE